jgi:hypothetical protein
MSKRSGSAVMPGDASDVQVIAQTIANVPYSRFRIDEVDAARSTINFRQPWSLRREQVTFWLRLELRQVDRQRMEVTIHSATRTIVDWGSNVRMIRMVLKALQAAQEERFRSRPQPPFGPTAPT